jgi:hypothetical protein
MKTLILVVASAAGVAAFSFGCAPKTGNYQMVHLDSKNAQQGLNQAILNHPLK